MNPPQMSTPCDGQQAPPQFTARLEERPQVGLSPRQAAVAALVARGLADKDVARQLGLAEETVGSYLKEVYRRLGIHSRTSLAFYWAATQRGLSATPPDVARTLPPPAGTPPDAPG